jgi:O-6-methylguanine DNA methyltransferase
MTSFQRLVYAAVKCIPKGETRSYQEVAQAVGHPRAYRAVASALARNTDPKVPCHRVILSSGKPGGYNGLRGVSKAALLAKESA